MSTVTEEQASSRTKWAARGPRILVLGLAGWMAIIDGLVLAVSWSNPVQRAIVGMAWGLIVLWIGGCGLAMWRWRDSGAGKRPVSGCRGR